MISFALEICAGSFVLGSLLSWLLWYVFPWRTATIRSLKSSAGFPSNLNPASKEMISDSFEMCETEVCFGHIQLIGTNVWLPKMHNVPPDVDFKSSRSPAKSESWNSPNLHCFGSVSHMTILFVFKCMTNVRDQTTYSFVTSFGQFRDRSCEFTHWPNLSGRPIRAKF